MKQEDLARLVREAEVEFMKYEGVVGVGYGAKEVGGRTTNRVAIRIYVREKRRASDLATGQQIPSTFKGFPTDVLIVPETQISACFDTEVHSPLIGGISITNLIAVAPFVGTLGFFGTVNGMAGPANVVLITANHIIADGGGKKGSTIYQPLRTPEGAIDSSVTNPIGKVHDVGMAANFKFTYPGETELDYYLDCATALLDIIISKSCNTNSGVSYRNHIRDLNIGGNSKIEGVARVAHADITNPDGTLKLYTVYKVGATTSRTVGKVVAVAGVGQTGGVIHRNLIEVEATEANCNGAMNFAQVGDSGSALVNSSSQIVGLVYAINQNTNPQKTVCSHIHPLLSRLKINPISTQNPPVPPAGKLEESLSSAVASGEIPISVLKGRVMRTKVGIQALELMERHQDEVISLVNHCRAVTVAWHRNSGPAFFGHLLESARHPAYTIPEVIEGVRREELVRNFGDALSKHGSSELRTVVERELPHLVKRAGGFESVDRLLRGIEASESERAEVDSDA